MIIRKPYAFLIKYFRQIHILLLVFAGYIYYKVNNLQTFINAYIDTEIYNPQLDAISNYISPLLYLAVFLLLVGTVIILILLRQKKKPRLTYILILVEYIALLLLFFFASSYFNGLNGASINSVQIRLIRGLLTVFSLFQFVVFILLVIRILGIDLQRFGFQNDEEFLQASEEDREEIEVGLNIDKDVYINKLKKQLRHFKYYYFENRFILNIIFVLCFIVLVFLIVRFALSFKTYEQGKSFQANGYDITINDVYTSKYNSSGEVIEKNQSFVILDLTVVNQAANRVMNTDDFLLMNNDTTVTPTTKYNEYFTDLGTPYGKTILKYQEKYDYILIYRVPEKFVEGKYTLYYTNNSQNIKIKITPKDYSALEEQKEYKVNEEIQLNDTKFTILEYAFIDTIDYLYDRCNMNGCSVQNGSTYAKANQRFLSLEVESDSYTGYEFYQFLKDHAKVIYVVNNTEKEVAIETPIAEVYKGSTTYLTVPSEMVNAQSVFLNIQLRNTNYRYRLK